MKAGWIVKKLGDVCHIQYGYAFDSSCFCDDKAYPQLVRIRDVVRGYSETYYKGNVSEEYYVEKGDYLIGMDGEFNIAPWKSERALLNQRVCKVSASDSNVIDRYVYYYLCIALKLIEAETPFVTVKHLSAKKLNSVIIPIPPLPDQSRIVEELDQLSNIIEKKRQQLSELDNLAQSIFYDMFGDPVTNEKGWEVKTLKDVTSKIGSGATPKGGNESYKDEGVSLIRSLNVYNNSFKYKDLAHIDNEQAGALSNVVEYGDVLLNITGASVARCCIVPMNVLPARVNQHVSIIRGKGIINNIFLNYQLTSRAYQSSLITLSKSNGATREALTKGQLETLKIILPPLHLQQLFASKIEAIEKEKELIKQSIKETEELFNSRMDYYFG